MASSATSFGMRATCAAFAMQYSAEEVRRGYCDKEKESENEKEQNARWKVPSTVYPLSSALLHSGSSDCWQNEQARHEPLIHCTARVRLVKK